MLKTLIAILALQLAKSWVAQETGWCEPQQSCPQRLQKKGVCGLRGNKFYLNHCIACQDVFIM